MALLGALVYADSSREARQRGSPATTSMRMRATRRTPRPSMKEEAGAPVLAVALVEAEEPMRRRHRCMAFDSFVEEAVVENHYYPLHRYLMRLSMHSR